MLPRYIRIENEKKKKKKHTEMEIFRTAGC